jgi:large subunit ribosomal protein L29
MKRADLREMSDEQLGLTLKEMVKNLFHLRFQSATERLETPSEIKKTRRDIACIKTIQRERRLVQEFLRRLPEAEAAKVKQAKPAHQLTAARAALARVGPASAKRSAPAKAAAK